MRRIDAPEILDSDACSPDEVQAALKTLGRINRWFGGVSTTQKLIERVAEATGRKTFSLLEIASGTGKVPLTVRDRLGRRGISLSVTLLDRAHSHLAAGSAANGESDCKVPAVAGDGLDLPFHEAAFDLVSCNLFAHHLAPEQLVFFVREALRVSRTALLINDLVRHPMHLALVRASFPIMGSRVAWLDGLTSVQRAYTPDEIRALISSSVKGISKMEISRHYLFRMGVIVWKEN